MKRHFMNETLDGLKDGEARALAIPGPNVRLMQKFQVYPGKSVPGLSKNQNCYLCVNHVCTCSNISDMYILQMAARWLLSVTDLWVQQEERQVNPLYCILWINFHPQENCYLSKAVCHDQRNQLKNVLSTCQGV